MNTFETLSLFCCMSLSPPNEKKLVTKEKKLERRAHFLPLPPYNACAERPYWSRGVTPLGPQVPETQFVRGASCSLGLIFVRELSVRQSNQELLPTGERNLPAGKTGNRALEVERTSTRAMEGLHCFISTPRSVMNALKDYSWRYSIFFSLSRNPWKRPQPTMR